MTEPEKPIATYGITRDAADPKQGLTLDELGAFVQACHRLGQPGDTSIRINIGWSSQIKTIRSHPRPITQRDRCGALNRTMLKECSRPPGHDGRHADKGFTWWDLQ